MRTSRNLDLGRLRKPRSQRRMWASAVVVANVLAKYPLQMSCMEWNEKVEALAPDGSDQSFAIRIRLGCANRRFQDPYAESLQLGITGRENRIAVVDDVSVWMIERQKLAELLNRPFGSGMVGHV